MDPSCDKVEPFLAYAPSSGYTEVPDPYYTGNFEEVYGLVSAASDGLLTSIRRRHAV
jgi:protein-tyrosine phosphatase